MSVRNIRLGTVVGALALGLTLMGAAQLAWSGNAKIKIIGPQNTDEMGDIDDQADDRVVAQFSYEKTETTQLCGGKMGPSSLVVVVHTDRTYTGTETISRLFCPESGLVRKASMTKYEGRLSKAEFEKLWDRLGEMTAQSRDIASKAKGKAKATSSKKRLANHLVDEDAEYEVHIKRAPDKNGVQAVGVAYLPEVVQTGQAALSSVRFMQAFVMDGKIN